MPNSVLVPVSEPIKVKDSAESTEAKKNAKVEAAQKECEDKQKVLDKANEAAVKAHADLMNAQKELARITGSL